MLFARSLSFKFQRPIDEVFFICSLSLLQCLVFVASFFAFLLSLCGLWLCRRAGSREGKKGAVSTFIYLWEQIMKRRVVPTNCRGALYVFCLVFVLSLYGNSAYSSSNSVSYKNGTLGKKINGSVSRRQEDIYAFNITKMLNDSQVS